MQIREEETILYRAVRELMMNVVKHADADHARVYLERQDNQLLLHVCDDGRGFDASLAGKQFSPSGGYGLFSIDEYILHLGGSMTVESEPGKGTRVTILLPLKCEE